MALFWGGEARRPTGEMQTPFAADKKHIGRLTVACAQKKGKQVSNSRNSFYPLKLVQADIGNFFVIYARVINNIEAHVRISFSKQPVLTQRECANVILRLKCMRIANDKIDLIFILCPPKFNLIQPGVL